ncbi:MAG: metallophosphoesterase [Oscillospiraceae bacterium]|nr:metallophosphoesterase [Oscillospiraceae bacterium]
MQILVISDTHGRQDLLRRAVLMHENADYIVHCGDGEQECDALLTEFPALAPKLWFVRGNCDFSSRSPELMTLDLPFSHRAVITHGHRYTAGSLRENLVRLARSQDADLVLFGHIHTRVDETVRGVRLFNPGSAALPRDGQLPSFGLVDIFESGILTSHGSLRTSPFPLR